MNILDWIILVTIFLLVRRSLKRGAVKEIFSLFAIAIALFLAMLLSPLISHLFFPLTSSRILAQAIGFIILFILVVFLVNLLGGLLSKLLRKLYLGPVDHILGAILGLAKGCLIVSLALIILGVFLPQKSSILKESKLSPYLISAIKELSQLLPHKFQSLLPEKGSESKKRERQKK